MGENFSSDLNECHMEYLIERNRGALEIQKSYKTFDSCIT